MLAATQLRPLLRDTVPLSSSWSQLRKAPTIFRNLPKAEAVAMWEAVGMQYRTNHAGWPGCDAGEPGGLIFKQGIDPRNLRISRTASVRVRLDRAWPQLVERLAEVGDAFLLTRNVAAVMGVERRMPELSACEHGHARDAGHLLAYDLNEWGEGSAVLEHFAGSQVLGLEIADAAGKSFHRVCLTEHSDLRRFAELVREFQGGRHPEARFARGCAQAGWTERLIARKRDLVDPRFGAACPVDPAFVKDLLAHAATHCWEVESEVYTPGAVQSANTVLDSWTPGEAWSHLSGADFSLHLNLPGVTEWWLVATYAGGGRGCLLEAYNREDELLVTLSPTEVSQGRWQEWLGIRGLRN